MNSFLIRVILAGVLMAPQSSFSREKDISEVHQILATSQSKETNTRINEFSFYFLEKPYLKHPLGEGSIGQFDQNPRFRFDGFDCTTYIETVLALTLSQNPLEFGLLLDRIRYANGVVSFETRNHFTDLDWIPNNSREGFITDITRALFADQTRVAETTIDKPNWYKMLSFDRIHSNKDENKILLQKLRDLSLNFSAEESRIDFISIVELIEHPTLLDRIPNGSILNFVRANWNLRKTIGTNMNVSHQGFAVRKKDGLLYFRHASSELKKVNEEPLLGYLQKALSVKSISGINVLEVQDPK